MAIKSTAFYAQRQEMHTVCKLLPATNSGEKTMPVSWLDEKLSIP